MSKEITVRHEDGEITLHINSYPDSCPICHRGIDSRFLGGYLFDDSYSIEILCQCPISDCRHLFIGYYYNQEFPSDLRREFIFTRAEPIHFKPRDFEKIINSVSKDFVRIYNQAEEAEKLGLSDIAGPGLRKSLEFLIKDYVILKNPELVEKMKITLLGEVTANNINDSRIKTTAKRAAWLGNDETHYYRLWKDKDINDLKKLIELTVRWIESVELTKDYENDMPSGKKK
jgi:hypothetical protein